MRRLLPVVLFGFIVLSHTTLRADDLVYIRFGDYLESLRAQTGVPGLSAALIGQNDVAWERAFGSQDLERSIAMRLDTPAHVDGLTELFSATLVLRCVEEGRLSLDDRIGRFKPDAPDPSLTIRQVLTHTTGPADNATYAFRPDRLEALNVAIRACTNDSYRETLANLFDRNGMSESVPGPDVLTLVPPAEGVLTSEFDRYARVLGRLAVPYAVDAQRRASISSYTAKTLTPTTGIVATVRDLEKFDLALKAGVLLAPETLAAAWRPPVNALGQRLPHGLGWFVQTYNGETVVWQFGAGDNGSSSLIAMLPARGLTLVLVANSNGLAKSFSLASGDLTRSPFGLLFLQTFVR